MRHLSTERWRQIEAVLDQALELSAEDISAYLDQACDGDGELRAEVEALLTADSEASEAEDFLDVPAEEYAATLVDEMQAEPPQDLLAGRRLGPYLVTRRIGGGGMGEIYQAVDPRLDRKVAIKLLPPALSRNPKARERFTREAKAASALDHPNICTVYDIGVTDGGRMFIVMAYYAGETLEERLTRGPLPIEQARDLAIQIAHGLERAHSAGIVHRDVKPANVIVTEHDEAKILDFGIAKVAGDVALTRSGTSPGTPAYMSPEQARGDNVDARTDVWSLAAVLYQMLTGHRPFEGKSEIAIYDAIQDDDPEPVATRREQVPEVLATVVATSLAKEPGDRYQSMSELLELLDPLADRDTRTILLKGGDPVAVDGITEGVVVRTLMVTDLVASTRLSEQLGDRRFTELAIAHDRMARDLLVAHDGLEIDKTDGFLVLFERPIDAASCALAYHRGVAELNSELGQELAARAALHLGEVHVRRNPPEDVTRGAKPIEVEGIAKPLAARVAALAGPRQTLMTQGAFDLARRAAGEAAFDQRVRWVAHGEYLLKGVSEPVAVYEVGSEDSAPLAAPANSEKARRAEGVGGAVILGWRPAVGVRLPDRRHWVMREKLGQGGFGEVWLAGHTKISERRVFKFCYEADRLQALQREVTLFRLMKEALGTRDDIVRILDWNFDQAPYYLEAEYTRGGDLDQWAVAQGGLETIPLATRVELVAQVAEALAAAHSVGILHKDVKPSNILIGADSDGEPRARLTDFGIGFITDRSVLPESGVTLLGLTEEDTYLSAGTRLYMAPEILEGKAPSVQADLYALGVLLYQMIAGNFERAIARGWQRHVDDEILRDDIACFVDGAPDRRPTSARSIAKRLRSLEQRRAEREAEDRARREAEQARVALERGKRRRKILATAVAVLAVFGALMTFQVRRTQEEAARAERESAAARQVVDFLENLFEVVDPSEARGNTVTAREILDRGAERIEAELADQPEVQARLMGVIGAVYRNLGLYQPAGSLTERALELRRTIRGPKHPEVALSLTQLGRLLFLTGEYEQAEAPLREALAMRRELLGNDHEDVAETLSELGNVLVSRGKAEAAETYYQESLRIRRQRFEEPHGKIAEALFNLAISKHFRDDTAAENLYRQALAMYEEVYGASHPAVGDVLNNYGHLLKTRGDLSAAEPLIRRSLEIARSVLGADHHHLAISESNFARLLVAKGEHPAAEASARRATAILSGQLGEDHWQTAVARSVLGASLAGQGKLEEAEKLLVASYRVIRAEHGDDFNYLHETLKSLIAMYDAWDKPELATNYRDVLAKLEP